MRRFFIVIMMLLAVLAVDAQSIRQGQMARMHAHPAARGGSSVRGNTPQSKLNAGSRQRTSVKGNGGDVMTDVPIRRRDNLPDTVYCHTTKKQHGWFEPLGMLTKEQASHRKISYRFTHRNSKGHWCKMEVIDGYGRYTTGNLSPYILKLGAVDTDTLANQEWAEKLKTTCIYEFIADPTGEIIIQERAYDEDMNVIYIYSRTPIGEDKYGHQQYVGSYKDIYGLPAEMRKDTTGTYTYGTLVMLTEDKWGNDSVVEYMDAKAKKKLNSDGVAMEIYVQDKEGHCVKQISCNEDGKPIIDNWGNCGFEVTLNEDHTTSSAMYMDANWNPMRMPLLRDVSEKAGIMKVVYRYDEFKRNTEEWFEDSEGHADENIYGTHKIVYTFDDNGNMTGYRSYDKNGNLSPMDATQTAVRKSTYTPEGKPIDHCFYDKNEQPLSLPNYSSRIHYEYDDQGKQTLGEWYSAENGREHMTSSDIYADTYEYHLYTDGSSRVDSLDNKGRTYYTGWFGHDGNPQMIDGRASERTVYVDNGKTTTSIVENFDENGNPTEDENGIYKFVYVTDSTDYTKKVFRYKLNGDLIDSYIHQYDDGFKKLLMQYDANAFGVVGRCGGTSGTIHYKADVLRSQKGEFASIIGKDEFDEPDYIVTSSDVYYYQRVTKGLYVRYDENNEVISDYKKLKDNLPKAMTIEVTDSSAYRLGLRDNDIILLFGDYYNDLEKTTSLYSFRSDWAIRTILDGQKTRRMVVFRIEDAKTNQFRLVEIKGLKGTPAELGIIPHIRYLTARQKARVMQAIHDNEVSDHPYITSLDRNKEKWNGNRYIIFAYPDMVRPNRFKPYSKQIKDPAVLLGTCLVKRNMSWLMPQGDSGSINTIFNIRKKDSPEDFFLTKDMKNLTSLTTDESSLGASWYVENVSDEVYHQLMTLNPQVESRVNQLMASAPQFAEKDLCGRWQFDNEKLGDHSPEGYLQLAKDGTCEGTITYLGYVWIDGNRACFKIDRDLLGKWELAGSVMKFTPRKTDNLTLTCINVEDVEPEEKDQLIASYNDLVNKRKSYYYNDKMHFYPEFKDELVIQSLSKDSLVIDDTSVGIHLFRTNTVRSRQKLVSGLKPHEFFSKLSKNPDVMYASHAINFINVDSLYLPEVFNDIEMVYIGKAQSKDLYNSVKNEMGSMIDTPGYVKLPTFYSEDLALVKKEGERLFSELLLVYVMDDHLRVLYQKGCFSSEELMALQNKYGKKRKMWLFEGADGASENPLLFLRTIRDGLARQAGMEGSYVLLELNGCNLFNGHQNLKETVESAKQSTKRMVFLPIHWDADDSFARFGEPLLYEFGEGTLGMRYSDWTVSEAVYNRAASAYEKFMRTHKKKNPAKVSLSQRELPHGLQPDDFFSKLRKHPDVMYTSHVINFLNDDSLRLPKVFHDLEMVQIGKAQHEDLYNSIKDGMGSMIDTTGYIRLPHFSSQHMALVKRDGDQLFSEVLLIYIMKYNARAYYQKGCFSADELMALQRIFGDGTSSSLFDDSDEESGIPLQHFRTEEDGLARQAGIEGDYVMLEYNGWNLSKGQDSLKETVESAKKSRKRIVLMPILFNRDNSFAFGDPQLYEIGEGILGMRYGDWTVSEALYKRAVSAYEKFKRMHKKDYK